MLGGGYFRGSSTLVSGSPGTAKTTLAGAFIRECCERGEHAVYLCFDEGADEIVRNLQSVNIRLTPYIERGLLHMVTALSETRSAEEHFLVVRNLLTDDRVKVLVIDPISAMVKSGGDAIAIVAVQRLIRLTKSRGVSLFLTSLLASPDTQVEATPIQISTVADTWIHISYVVLGGERNRALTIVKSRGSRHSNQVRELLLSDDGITLSDVYTAKGQVLMGTARWQKEAAERLEAEQLELDYQRRLREIVARQADAKARLESIQREIEAQEVEARLLKSGHAARSSQVADQQRQLHMMRGGDAAADANTK
jgi:circadian clock protein KaiC